MSFFGFLSTRQIEVAGSMTLHLMVGIGQPLWLLGAEWELSHRLIFWTCSQNFVFIHPTRKNQQQKRPKFGGN